MNKVKILHCGDFHFDSAFSGLNHNIAEERKEDLRETFGKIIDLAKEEETNILLISGDFFDNSTVKIETISYIFRKFNEIPNTRIFIAPGNHDPIHEKSFYKILPWPHNVHIFNNKIEKVFIEEYNTTVYGIGFDKNHEKNSLIKDFKVEDRNSINIMVLHGEVVSNLGESLYNPIKEVEIKNSGLDYLALGHTHSFSGFKKSGDTTWCYCGNPEGRGFDELGSKGVILGEVSKGFCNLSFKEVCKRKYIIDEVDITGVLNYYDIVERIGKLGDKTNFYKLILTGEVDKDFNINTSLIEEKILEDFYFVKIENKTRVLIDYTSEVDDFSLKGIFIKKVRDSIERSRDLDEKSNLEEALKLGIKALEMKEVNLYED